MLRQERAGAGDDGDVEAKKQAAERGGGGQKDDVANIDVVFMQFANYTAIKSFGRATTRELMMGKALTKHQLGEYQQQGFLFPLPILSESETAALRGKLEELEINQGGRLPARINRKPHLLLTWLNELIRDPRILDPVEDILGPNILCWGSGFFIKNAHDPARVTWHQDSTYWGLSKPDIVTAWVAFTPSTPENGCMRVVPGTHTLQQLPHRDTFAQDNLLSRGQEIAVEVDESKAVDIVLDRRTDVAASRNAGSWL